MKYLLLLALISSSAFASDLQDKLKKLNIPDDKIAPLVTKDKLYTINKRYSSLTNRHEVSTFYGNNFTADSHIVSSQMGATYRYHIDPSFSVGIRYSEMANDLSESGKTLFRENARIVDTDFANNSTDVFMNFNFLYGKLAIGNSRVVYFDQYMALGVGSIDLASGVQSFATVDIGLAFWLGKNYSARFGVKNEMYTQRTRVESKRRNNAIGYMGIGYLFGEGSTL
jgi:outer membrane beta-barrel protein